MPVVPSPPKSSVTPSFSDSAADAYARVAKNRAETTVALDATNQLQGLKFDLSNPDTGYKSLLGGDAAKARAALVADGLGQGLSGEDLDKRTNLAFGRRVVEPVVTARLSQGDVAGAKAFFDIHRAGMAGDDADILDRRLAEAGQAWDTKTAIDGLWNRLGPKSFNDPIDLNAIEDGLVVYHGGDGEARIRAHDEVLHRILGFTQARDETHAGYVNFLIDQVKGGASPSQIAALPQFLALPKDKQRQLSDWHREQLADKLTGFAPDQTLGRMARQFAAYHDLSGDDALKSMSDARVQALEPVLGEDLTRQALAKRQASQSLDATDFSALARSIGVDPNPAPSDTLGKAQLGVLRSVADKAVATSGTALTPQQQRETALGAAQTAIAGHPLFQLPPEVQRVLDMTPTDILGPTTSAFSPEPWSRPPVDVPQPTKGPGAPAPEPVRSPPAPPDLSLPSPSEDPVIRQASEKASQLEKVAEGWARATNLAKDAAKAGAKWLIRRAPVVGTIAGLAAPNEIGTEVSTYLFGRNASDTNLRLSGRSDDLSRVVQIRREGLLGPTWETIARAEPDKGGHGSYRIVDPATFAKRTGLDWDTIVLQSTGGKPRDKVGFGVAVNNDEERAILNDGIANRDSATNIQRRIDALRAGQGAQANAGKLRPPAAPVAREAIAKDLDNAIQPYLSEIRKVDPSAVIGYRGSLASGVKGPHKGGGPFDPSNFDIDLFIVSNKMAGAVKSQSSFRNGGRIPEIAAVQRALEAELRKNPNFAGLRRGEREKLTFRIYTSQDAWYQRKTGDKQTIFLKRNKD